jgi:hypothetical protein
MTIAFKPSEITRFLSGFFINGFGASGVIFYAFFTFAAIGWAGTYSGGTGTVANPYQISTVADWQELIAASADWDKCFVLLNDIDFEGINLTPVAPDIDPNVEYFQGTAFSGIFDGKDHKLCNPTVRQRDQDCVGLFGCIGIGGHISNMCIDNIIVSGRSQVGTVAGLNDGLISFFIITGSVIGESRDVGGIVGCLNPFGLISNSAYTGSINGITAVGGLAGTNYGKAQSCITNITIQGTDYVGGIAGTNYNTYIQGIEPAVIIDCSSSGNLFCEVFGGGLVGFDDEGYISTCTAFVDVTQVSAGNSSFSHIGGLVGHAWISRINSCSANGSVNGLGDGVGGLVGISSEETIINSCFAKGSVKGNSYIGGLIGWYTNSYQYGGNISSCYSAGSVEGLGEYVGGFIGMSTLGYYKYCYSISPVIGNDSCVYIGGFLGCSNYGVISSCFWDLPVSGQFKSGGGYPLSTEQMKSLSTFQNAGWFNNGWIINDGNDVPRLSWELTEGVTIPDAGMVPLVGRGTRKDPYQVWTNDDLIQLSRHIGISGKHIVLMSDLDLSGVSIFPIGEIAGPISFNGNGHTIMNLVINQPGRSNVGLFSGIGAGASVSNLRLVNVNITGQNNVGSLSGGCSGSIIRCESSGVVTGYGDRVGGLIGRGGYQGIISSSICSGTVSGRCQVGGIAGSIWFGNVTFCYSNADIAGEGWIGGLVGDNDEGYIRYSLSAGMVTGTTDRYIGGLCGIGGNSTRITSSFWDIQTSGITTSSGGTGKTSVEMKRISTFTLAGWDFVGEAANGTEDVWRMCADGVDYPRLSWEFSRGGDMDCPDGVGMEDLVYLAGRWLNPSWAGFGTADINRDGKVDLSDFEILASNWMRM